MKFNSNLRWQKGKTLFVFATRIRRLTSSWSTANLKQSLSLFLFLQLGFMSSSTDRLRRITLRQMQTRILLLVSRKSWRLSVMLLHGHHWYLHQHYLEQNTGAVTSKSSFKIGGLGTFLIKIVAADFTFYVWLQSVLLHFLFSFLLCGIRNSCKSVHWCLNMKRCHLPDMPVATLRYMLLLRSRTQ